MYPTCNAHVPYCDLWLNWLYSIFPNQLIKDAIFGKKKKVTEYKIVF